MAEFLQNRKHQIGGGGGGEDLDGKSLRKTHSKTASHSVDNLKGGTFLSGVHVDFVCKEIRRDCGFEKRSKIRGLIFWTQLNLALKTALL